MKPRYGSGSRKALVNKWNNPDVRIQVNEQRYVGLFNSLVNAFYPEGSANLERLADLPAVIDAYSAIASAARNAGDLESYTRSAQCAALLKKLELPLFEDDARKAAVTKWLAAEAACKEKNAECWEILQHPLTHSQGELEEHLRKVRTEIAEILGEFPPDLPEIVQGMRFGPGSDLSHARVNGAPLHKMDNHTAYEGMQGDVHWLVENTGLFGEMLCDILPANDGATPSQGSSVPFPSDMDTTKWNTPFESLAHSALLGVLKPDVVFVDHAKLDFVPKSVREMRTIEIGPSLAILFQQAYDKTIRDKLESCWGVNLRDQEPNKELARQGSIADGKPNCPCTIDLSSASDRISMGIVAMLLPRAWVRALLPYRAKKVLLPDGTFHTLEKFSSMGNSYTFSLQTLIYSAVVRSVLREHGWEGSRWRCYGDDIIVPHRIYDDTVKRLQALGFEVNISKSFSYGPFRESCGGDYLHGQYVRPLYIKKPLTTVAEVFKVLNLCQLTAVLVPSLEVGLRTLYRELLTLLPKGMMLMGDTSNSLDSCVWAPVVGSSFVLRKVERHIKERSAKKRYLVSLFSGYQGSDGWNPLKPIQPHNGVCQTIDAGYVIRRATHRGLVSRPLRPEELPFNAFLMRK